MVSTPYLLNSNADLDEIPIKPRSFSRAPLSLQPKLTELHEKVMKQTDYEPPGAYWSMLWDTPRLVKHAKITYKIEIQGSVIRVKSRRPLGEKGRTFARDWQQPPDMWSDDFLVDGYDRFNTNDREKYGAKRPKGNKRPIHEFSVNSRRLLLDRLMSIEPSAWDRAQFATVTYHHEWPKPKQAKDHVRALFKRIVRHCEKKKIRVPYKPAFFWRMEIKPRLSGERVGELAPHFHFFLFGCSRLPEALLLKWWRKITGDKTITQVDVKKLSNRRKAMNYVAKYVAKPTSADKEVSALTPEEEPADLVGHMKSYLIIRRLEQEQIDFPIAADDDNLKSTVLSEPEAVRPILDISLYLAAMGRFWGLEGGQNIPYAALSEVALPPRDASLCKFIAVCEALYPHLLSRRAYGFRLFVFEDERGRFEEILEELSFQNVLDKKGLDDFRPLDNVDMDIDF